MLESNSYFNDQVQSVAFHRNGRKSSVGAIAPGTYHFGTAAAERMTVISGSCSVVVDDTNHTIVYPAGTYFEIAANHGFTITCDEPCAYLCEYLA